MRTGTNETAKTASGDLPVLLTVKQVATFLAVSEKMIYGLVERRAIPHYKVSNRVRFDRDELLQWLAENRVPTMESSS